MAITFFFTSSQTHTVTVIPSPSSFIIHTLVCMHVHTHTCLCIHFVYLPTNLLFLREKPLHADAATSYCEQGLWLDFVVSAVDRPGKHISFAYYKHLISQKDGGDISCLHLHCFMNIYVASNSVFNHLQSIFEMCCTLESMIKETFWNLAFLPLNTRLSLTGN